MFPLPFYSSISGLCDNIPFITVLWHYSFYTRTVVHIVKVFPLPLKQYLLYPCTVILTVFPLSLYYYSLNFSLNYSIIFILLQFLVVVFPSSLYFGSILFIFVLTTVTLFLSSLYCLPKTRIVYKLSPLCHSDTAPVYLSDCRMYYPSKSSTPLLTQELFYTSSTSTP